MGSAPSRSESVPSLGTPKHKKHHLEKYQSQQSKSLPPLSTYKNNQNPKDPNCVKSQNSENDSQVISPFNGEFKLDSIEDENHNNNNNNNIQQQIKISHDNIKISILGTQTAVGKSTLMRNFVEQEVSFLEHNPTLGIEFQSKNFFVCPTMHVTYNIFELQNSDQVWQKMPATDILFLVFDDFQQGMDRQLKNKIEILKRCNKSKQFSLILVGNDKLDMKISGLDAILKSDFIKDVEAVNIINFNYLKEVNDLFIKAYETKVRNQNCPQKQLVIKNNNSNNSKCKSSKNSNT